MGKSKERHGWGEALAWADRARAVCDEMIERVGASHLSLSEAFAAADLDPLVGRVFAQKVCEVVPGVGKVRTRRTMAALGIADDATLAQVVGDRRAELIASLTATGTGTSI